MEETGYKINVLEFFGKSEKHWVSEKYPKWSQHNIGIFYECELNGKVTKPIEQEMILWVTYAELRTKLFHEHHLYIIDRYLDIQGYF